MRVCAMAETTWSISSNSGWQNLSGRLKAVVGERADSVYLFEIVYTALFWDRRDAHCERLVDDLTLRFHQVPMSGEKVLLLRSDLARWLQSPCEISRVLSPEPEGQRGCSVFIGPDKALISSAQKPVFRMTFGASAAPTQVQFVVDQSCLRLLYESLEWLQGEVASRPRDESRLLNRSQEK
jgi:hypothetical protein